MVNDAYTYLTVVGLCGVYCWKSHLFLVCNLSERCCVTRVCKFTTLLNIMLLISSQLYTTRCAFVISRMPRIGSGIL